VSIYVSIITISVSGPVTYIDLYRPSIETTGPEKYGSGVNHGDLCG